jgi:hypothetical protein
MALLFRLPLMLLELLVRRLFRRGADDVFAPVVTDEAARAAATPAPSAPRTPPTPPAPSTTPPATTFTGAGVNGAPPPTADEAIERRREREAVEQVAPDPTPPTPLRPISGHDDHVDREAEIVESFGPAEDVGDVGGTITVDAPWPDYDAQSASAIVQRLRSADAATKAVVALYERQNKNRATVLRAAG